MSKQKHTSFRTLFSGTNESKSVMAKEKLFPALTKTPDTREPHQRFEDFAAKIVAVPKAEVDKRETAWKKARATASTPDET